MTPEQLAELGHRLLAVIPRAPRGQALDTAAAEVGMLIAGLCPEPNQAEQLTAYLVALPWKRWSFGELRQAALRFTGHLPVPASTVAGFNLADWWPADELHALMVGLDRSDPEALGAGVAGAWERAWQAAEAAFDQLTPVDQRSLLDQAGAAYRDQITRWYPGQFLRTLEPPFLDRNARDLAVRWLYRSTLLGVPLGEEHCEGYCLPPHPAKQQHGLAHLAKLKRI